MLSMQKTPCLNCLCKLDRPLNFFLGLWPWQSPSPGVRDAPQGRRRSNASKSSCPFSGLVTGWQGPSLPQVFLDRKHATRHDWVWTGAHAIAHPANYHWAIAISSRDSIQLMKPKLDMSNAQNSIFESSKTFSNREFSFEKRAYLCIFSIFT